MRRLNNKRMMMLTFTLIPTVAVLLLGCAEPVPSDLSIRTIVTDLLYSGHTYSFTGERVGLERMSPKDLTYAGTAMSSQ